MWRAIHASSRAKGSPSTRRNLRPHRERFAHEPQAGAGRKRNELVDAVAPDIAARHARAATKRGATPAHFPERRELRFDVTHRVDSIAGRIVEIVRLAEGPSPDVHGI